MIALPLYQPWASLIAVGAKRIETRAYPPSRVGLAEGQRIAIYATKTLGPGGKRAFEELVVEAPFAEALVRGGYGFATGSSADVFVVDDDRLPRGALVAVAVLARASEITAEKAAELERTHPDEFAFGDYTPGRWAWVLEQVVAVDPRVAATTNRPGPFEVPDPQMAVSA